MSAQTDPTLKGPFAFVFRGGGVSVVFYFPLLPQDVRTEFPPRVAVHQTLDSNFVDDFSGARSVLATVIIRGTFGYSPKFGGVGLKVPGSVHTKTLETLLETFHGLSREVKGKLNVRAEYVNLASLHLWRIVIDKFGWRRNEQKPLLYDYELAFRRIDDYLSPVNPHLPERTGGPGATGLLGIF